MTQSSSDSFGSESGEGHSSADDLKELREPLDIIPLVARLMPSKGKPKNKSHGMREAKGKKHYHKVLELEDSDRRGFYANEDPDMIEWLGRDMFIELLRFASTRLLAKKYRSGLDGNLRLFKCTTSYTRSKCHCIYAEPEYDALSLEAHWEAK